MLFLKSNNATHRLAPDGAIYSLIGQSPSVSVTLRSNDDSGDLTLYDADIEIPLVDQVICGDASTYWHSEHGTGTYELKVHSSGTFVVDVIFNRSSHLISLSGTFDLVSVRQAEKRLNYGDRTSIDFRDVTIADVMAFIGKAYNVDLEYDPRNENLGKTIDLTIKNANLKEILDAIISGAQMPIQFSNSTIVIPRFRPTR